MLVKSVTCTLKLLAWSSCLLTCIWTGILSSAAAKQCQAYWLQLKPSAFNADFPLESECRYDLMSRWKPDEQNPYAKHIAGNFPYQYDSSTDNGTPRDGDVPAFTACYLFEPDTLCEGKKDNYFQLGAPPGPESEKKYGMFCMYGRNLLEKPELAPDNAWPGWTLDWENHFDAHKQCKLNYKYTGPTNAYWLTFHPPGHKAIGGDSCPYQLQAARLDSSHSGPARGTNALSGTDSVWYCRYIVADSRCGKNNNRPDDYFQVVGPNDGPNQMTYLGIFCPLKGDIRPPPTDAYAQAVVHYRPTWHYDVSASSWIHGWAER